MLVVKMVFGDMNDTLSYPPLSNLQRRSEFLQANVAACDPFRKLKAVWRGPKGPAFSQPGSWQLRDNPAKNEEGRCTSQHM
jgi:hypothetical protein